ncbi:MAG: RsmB/NOP family class I SAM-dependent RNA methyltransferase, partial [Muribaculaceae bacterium]|nr:RsmB/NOP family class I SAM-dependent RNA methyltransferase [Muribaculaceae bacterium]
ALLPDDADALLEALENAPEVTIKINRRKVSDSAVTGYDLSDRVLWCDSGFYLKERPKFTLNPLLHGGAFYVQDASSMIYETIMNGIIPMAFDTARKPAVIDLCAAPGGKTTSIINAVPDGCFVVANEFSAQRVSALKENLLKWGYPDIMITNSSVGKLSEAGAAFDVVAVDAPCSGEGMMRKEEMARKQWSKGLIEQCASLQRLILDDACKMLKPGGFMIYSTCTFNTTENEDQVKWLVEEKGLVPFDPGFPEEWNIMKGIDSIYPCFRFMPGHTRGEGLFVAVFRKETDKEEKTLALSKLKDWLRKNIKIVADGIPQKEMKGHDMVPCSQWALSTDFPMESFTTYDVEENEALS